jgi:serine/threonine-protein phosphatase Stp1
MEFDKHMPQGGINLSSQLMWRSTSRTHTGLVRRINEDSCLDTPLQGLWVVADGMGGHTAGDVASSCVVSHLRTFSPRCSAEETTSDIINRLSEANRRLRQEAESRGRDIIGSTVAALSICNSEGICIWAGDSRIYLLRDSRLRGLTRDHNLIEEYARLGYTDINETQNNVPGNVITRAVGAHDELIPEVRRFRIERGDKILLCSDGLYRELPEPDIERLMMGTDLDQVADDLINNSLDRGAHDNITFVLIYIDN